MQIGAITATNHCYCSHSLRSLFTLERSKFPSNLIYAANFARQYIKNKSQDDKNDTTHGEIESCCSYYCCCYRKFLLFIFYSILKNVQMLFLLSNISIYQYNYLMQLVSFYFDNEIFVLSFWFFLFSSYIFTLVETFLELMKR